MSRDRGRALNLEDRILWIKVAGSVTPLPGRSVPVIAEDGAPPPPAETRAKEPARPASPAPRRVPEPQPGALDRVTRRKLAKGRLPIQGKVDLHGLTQREAHDLLLTFLGRAFADDRRHVLVVTGKGASFGSEGVLKNSVPRWLATAPFRALVSGFEDAGRRHGGEGAIYVRLRRRGGEAP